jgi:hypothetical protein
MRFLFIFSACLSLVSSSSAIAGKGVGAGGGSALTRKFDLAQKSSIFLSSQLPGQDMNRISSCDTASRAAYPKIRAQMLSVMSGIELEWLQSGETSNSSALCAVLDHSRLILNEPACRTAAPTRKDAMKIMIRALLDGGRIASGHANRAVLSSCIADYFDHHYWRFAWSGQSNHEVMDELSRRASRLNDSLSSESPTTRLKESLSSARVIAFRSLRNLHNAVIPDDVNKDLLNWLHSSSGSNRPVRLILADDIELSPHAVAEYHPGQSTCAYTFFELRAVVRFSMNHCRKNIESQRDAIQTIVHESTHHKPFQVVDETLADRIGELVADIVEASPKTLYRTKEEIDGGLRNAEKTLDDIISTLP